MDAIARSVLTLLPIGFDRPATILDGMPTRLPIDDDSRRLVAKASPRPPALVKVALFAPVRAAEG